MRNEEFQPWKPVFDIYILKEDEERFKDILWLLLEADFEVVRYERRGRYYLVRNGEYIKVFVLTKVCSDVRHTGSSDFIHEKYIQNTVKWYFKGIQLNVPAEVDEYLEFQYGKDWTTPKQLASMQPRKYRKVMTVGVYDLLHKGHVELYRRAKGLGDYLIVAAQDGDFILKYKPTAQVMNSTEDRKYMIKAIRYVDEVITYTDVDKIVQEVDFDVFVTGPDQIHAGFQRAIQWCEEHGKEHIVLGRTDGISSSELKAKIAAKTKK